MMIRNHRYLHLTVTYVICFFRRRLRQKKKALVDSDSTITNHSDLRKTDYSTSMYSSVEKKSMGRASDELRSEEEISLHGLPRVKSLNDVDVQSISSSILDGDGNYSEASSHSGYKVHGSGSSTSGIYSDTDVHSTSRSNGHAHARRVSNARRMNAIKVARSMSLAEGGGGNRRLSRIGEERLSQRRISVMSGNSGGSTSYLGPGSPTTRHINAFGEITVMPVGESGHDTQITVEEELY